MKPIEIVCKHCEGSRVLLDAYAEWSVESQDWELCSTFDNAYCLDCEGETTPTEKELEL